MEIIKYDTFFIADRLKEIDSGYYIVYNKLKSRYEVHHTNQGTSTLAVVVPYNSLDVRTIDLVNKTRIENLDKVIKEMERDNEKLGGSYFAMQRNSKACC